MNKRAVILTAAILVLGTGISVVSAHGLFSGMANATPEEIAQHQQQRFEHEASLLGTDVDTVKNAWAEGKTLKDVADELGVTQEQLQERLQEEHKQRMQEHLDALVQQGVITQEQADARAQFMQDHAGDHSQGKGFHHGGFFGPPM